jgi:glycosyltransferase involved in cell wall biosynthesis
MYGSMLVSAAVTPRLRADVAEGRRPCPEFLKLEAEHGVRLLDWTATGISPATARSAEKSLRHVRSALRDVAEADAVLSDGEHVGVPLAIAMRALRIETRHVMIGHHLTTSAKVPWFRLLHAERRIDRILVHSVRHQLLACRRLRLGDDKVQVVPYGVDTDFWQPETGASEPMILAPGREHRDYRTLARACEGLPIGVFVADASLHNPQARRTGPIHWPANVRRGTANPVGLRQLYSRAQIVVVPLVATDFPAGITAVLEAMAMAKPLIVSATKGLAGVVEDGSTAIHVPPGDSAALAAAIISLAADPAEQRRLGRNARDAVVARFGVGLYADRLATHLAVDEGCAQRVRA